MDPPLAAPCSAVISIGGTVVGRVGVNVPGALPSAAGDFDVMGIGASGSITVQARRDSPSGSISFQVTCPDPNPCGPTEAQFAFQPVGAPPPLPEEVCQPCQWKLHVKVHSQERFWPKDPFNVQFGAVGAAAPPPSLVPPIAPAWYTGSVKMTSKVSDKTTWVDSGLKNGGVTATVHTLAKEKDWVLVTGINSKTLLDKQYVPQTINNGQVRKVDLFIRHPLKVYLEFKFLDPEKKELTFPKDFPIQVWSKSKILEKKTDEKGRVAFELTRKYDWITFKFGNGPVYIALADAAAGKTELKKEADRKNLTLNAAKFFGPPSSWALIESIWKFSEQPKFIDGAAAYKEDEGKIYLWKDPNWVRRIGEDGAPVTLTLDPHWQFNRFEFFDRYYGHTNHGHKRANIPPVLVEAMQTRGATEAKEGSGHWVLNEKSITESVHAVPWIRQKTKDGKKSEKPDKDSFLRIKQDAGMFSVSSDASTRKIEFVKDTDKRLDPGVDRLKLYDLPKRWESLKYWTRFGKDAAQVGKFWKDWTPADYLKSRAVADPLTFSLDDIVLTNTGMNPLKLTNADQFAIFYHRFKPDYNEAANVSPHGVYKPDPKDAYYSTVKLAGPQFNYLTEYPNWVRLLAGLGSLYDAFDRRTVSGILGARAGVKWYDPKASGVPAPGPVGWQNALNKKHFILEPYYGQSHHKHWMQYNAGGGRTGRFDMTLIRNCDRVGADNKELFLSMQFYRLLYNFTAQSLLVGAAQKTFVQDSALALMDRWNGNDVASAFRGEIVPQDKALPHTGEVLWFIQPALGKSDAHFKIDVKKFPGSARAWMNGSDGTGEVDDSYAKAAKAYGTTNAYILAHELGHGGSMPDEYAERSNWSSQGTAGFSCNTPGDPFVDEGLYPDFTASIYGAAPVDPPFPMMTQTVQMRNRYFWHNAEFARKFMKVPMFAKYGAYPEYKVPGHPNYPRKGYTYWPVNAVLNKKLGAKGKADLYLNAAGKERYTVDLIPKGPYDGFLTLLLKLVLYETAAASQEVAVRNAIRNTVRGYNKRFFASGNVDVTTDSGKVDLALAKTMFRLSPRFAMDAPDKTLADFAAAANPAKAFNNYKATYASDFKDTLNTFGSHFSIHIKDAKVGASGYNAATKKYDLIVDYTSPNLANLVATWAEQYFREMIGVAYDPANPNKLAAADLKAIAQAAFTKNGNVGDL